MALYYSCVLAVKNREPVFGIIYCSLLHLDKQETKLCVTSKGAGVKASTLSHNNRELTLCCSGPGVGGGLSIHKVKGEPRDVTVLFRV